MPKRKKKTQGVSSRKSKILLAVIITGALLLMALLFAANAKRPPNQPQRFGQNSHGVTECTQQKKI
jgi:hypothetical protein